MTSWRISLILAGLLFILLASACFAAVRTDRTTIAIESDEPTAAPTQQAAASLSALTRPPQQEPVSFSALKGAVPGISLVSPEATECGSAPVNGCDVSQSTTFTRNTYTLPDGITVSGNNIVLDCNGATLQATTADNTSGSDGIQVFGQNVTIRNCNIKRYMDAALRGTVGTSIQRSNIIDCARGISLYDADLSRVTYTNFSNHFTDSEHYFLWAVYLSNASHVILDHNMISDAGSSILVTDGSVFNPPYPQNLTITNNHLLGASFAGIDLENYRDSTTKKLVGLTIVGNTFGSGRNPMNWGIYTDVNVESATIMNNTFQDLNRSGMITEGSHLIIANNTFRNMGTTEYVAAIWLDSYRHNATDIQIYNNYVENVYIHGIYMDLSCTGCNLSTAPWVQNVSVFNNTVVQADNCGIFLREHTRNIDVYDNTFNNNYIGACLELNHNNTIRSNELSFNSRAGLHMIFSYDTRFYLNRVLYNTLYAVETYEQTELSYAQVGNYWGHTSQPCFDPATDASSPDVSDSYAFCTSPPQESVTIPVKQSYSWGFFSFNSQPTSTNPEIVMQSLQPYTSHLSFVKSFVNSIPSVYYADDPWGSDMTSMTYKYGYWMKVLERPADSSMVIYGNALPSCPTLSLNTGIHWVGYWGKEPRAVPAVFNSVQGKYAWASTYVDGKALVYDPAHPELSDLTVVYPGQAIRIKMTAPGVLNYCS